MFCSQGLADNTVIAKVNGELWDLDRPLEQDVTLQLLKFDDKDGKNILGFYLYNCSRFQVTSPCGIFFKGNYSLTVFVCVFFMFN